MDSRTIFSGELISFFMFGGCQGIPGKQVIRILINKREKRWNEKIQDRSF